jgi:hypothetical protein
LEEGFPPLRAFFFELDRAVFAVEPFRFAPRDDFLEIGFLDRAFVAVRVFLATGLLLLLLAREALRRPLTALAAKAPTTPPTTAPIGPATLPTAAPATIGGI